MVIGVRESVSGVRGARSTLTFQGGLGNQLFQWAFGQALRAAGVDLAADTVRCRGDRPLAVGTLLADWPRVSRAGGLWLALRQKASERLPVPEDPTFVVEREAGFDPLLAEAATRPGRHVVGYFQSPRYFDAQGPAIRLQVLAFLRGSLTDEGRALAEDLLTRDDTVGVHVRRGDYVSNPVAASIHGVLPEDYYRRALRRTDELGLRRLWFSDDPGWVRDNLAAPGDRFCEPAFTTAAAGEIALLASCPARIVANSSFSWWGGYLGAEPTARRPVVAPARWFGDGRPAHELVPESWERL